MKNELKRNLIQGRTQQQVAGDEMIMGYTLMVGAIFVCGVILYNTIISVI